MLTWSTFKRNKNGGLSRVEIFDSRIDYGESITDKSKYNPNISSFISNMGSIKNNPLYDFMDGQDTGIRMSLFHDNSLDITEKQAIFERFKAETVNRLDELEEQLKKEIELKNALDKTKEESEKVLINKNDNSSGEAAK